MIKENNLVKKFIVVSVVLGFLYQGITVKLILTANFSAFSDYFLTPSFYILRFLCGLTEETFLTSNLCQHGGGVTIVLVISLIMILMVALLGYGLGHLFLRLKTDRS